MFKSDGLVCYDVVTKHERRLSMQEITVRNNELGLKVFIDGEPALKELPDDDLTVLATVLEVIIERRYANYIKRKGDGKKKKVSVKSDT